MPSDPKAEHAQTDTDESKKGAAEDGDSDFDDALSTIETRRRTAAERAREVADTKDKKGEESPAARKTIAALDDALEDLEEVSPKASKALKAWAKSLVEGLGDRDKELDGLKGLKDVAAFKDLLPRVAALTNDSETKQAREAHRALDAIASKGLSKQFGANRTDRMADDTIRGRCIELLKEAKELQSELEDQGKDLTLKQVVEKLAKKRYPGKMTEGEGKDDKKADSKADQVKRAAASSDIRPGRTGDGKFVAKGSEAKRMAAVETFVAKRKGSG